MNAGGRGFVGEERDAQLEVDRRSKVAGDLQDRLCGVAAALYASLAADLNNECCGANVPLQHDTDSVAARPVNVQMVSWLRAYKCGGLALPALSSMTIRSDCRLVQIVDPANARPLLSASSACQRRGR
jgi:hypothetical protein